MNWPFIKNETGTVLILIHCRKPIGVQLGSNREPAFTAFVAKMTTARQLLLFQVKSKNFYRYQIKGWLYQLFMFCRNGQGYEKLEGVLLENFKNTLWLMQN